MLTDIQHSNIDLENLDFSVEIKELSVMHVAAMECNVNMA